MRALHASNPVTAAPRRTTDLADETGLAVRDFAQTREDVRVDLADARFREIENATDLLHREPFVVVHDDDALLLLGEVRGQHFEDVARVKLVDRRIAVDVRHDLRVFETAVVVAVVELVVQREHGDGVRFLGHLLVFLHRDAELFGHLEVRRLAADARGQGLHRAGDLVGLEADEARDPVLRPEFVEIAPRMRMPQYVLNSMPRPMSKPSMASMRPKRPAEQRSSTSIERGRVASKRSLM
jgi:hypothetical protein